MTELAAEARKATTTRTNLWLAVGASAVVAVGALMTTSTAAAQDLVGAVHRQPFFVLGSVNVSLFALLVGVRASTDEFRYGTIEWSFLAVRRRWRLIVAKATISAAVGAVTGAIAAIAGIAIAIPVSASQGGDLEIDGSVLVGVVGLASAAALWSALGVGVGMVVRHQVTAAVAAAVWILAIENLGASFLGDAGRWLPGQAAHALAHVDLATPLLSRPLAAAALVSYAAIVVALGGIHAERRAISR